MAASHAGIFLCAAAALSAAQVGQDCTGVECGELENCIEETLDGGACCARCLRRGCVCSGYEYYDCLQAGFWRGRVPAGTSYDVDSGSTVCRCPETGGKISCNFIPCPELPPNCVQPYQPRDGCAQCVRLGCPSGGRLLPAGSSFRPEPCTLCRCLPSGNLACTAEPGCQQGSMLGQDSRILNDQRHLEAADMGPRVTPGADREQTGTRAEEEKVEEKQTDSIQTSDTARLPESLSSCCTDGRRQASEDWKCLRKSTSRAELELCRDLQEQCCLSALEEARCQAGLSAAQSGDPCSLEDQENCGSDPFQRCCRCCALGLHSAAQDLTCDQTLALDVTCSQAFAACCRRGALHSPSSGNRREARRPQEAPSTGGDGGGGDSGQGNSSPEVGDICQGPSRCSQICSPLGLAYVCTCRPGYRLLADGSSCEDVNECTAGIHNCSEQHWCVNLEGSFSCVRSSDLCLEGYTANEQGTCVDTNECLSLDQPCLSGLNCINTIGSFSCLRTPISCSRGYQASLDNARCVDIDECQVGTHRCPAEQVCRNVPGSYRCDCRPGYQTDPFTRSCVDINECQRYMGRICAQQCQNTPGSYQCGCSEGYKLAPDSRGCEDVDECQRGPCSQDCVNVLGSYQCHCRRGYTLSPSDRTACLDIDECSLATSPLCAYQCVNTLGSFSCTCPVEGYVLSPNGRNCKDLDECALGTHNCTEAESCFNIQGGYKCLSFECPANYRRVSQNRCERESCKDYVECQMVPQRITYYQLSLPPNVRVPANIFRISPSPVYAGDNILLAIPKGNEAMFFSTRRVNNFTGFVYLQRPPHGPSDFLLDVEMTLIRQGTATKFIARIYVFITGPAL